MLLMQSGEVIEVSGPDVQTTCGDDGRLLDISTSYVAGIGHRCSPISSWTERASYSSEELELLRDFSEDVTCGEMTLLPTSKLLLSIFIILIIILI